MKIFNFKFPISNFQLLSAAACLLFAVPVQAASWQWIDGPRVQGKVKEGSSLWLIDVRSSTAYEAVHIEGSVNIPAAELLHKKFPLQKTLILVDDALGQKAAREAAGVLVKQGRENVYILEGGITAWKTEGLPVVETASQDRGVTAADLKWAIASSVPMKIYDLRDSQDQALGSVQSSEAIGGKNVAERVGKLKGMFPSEDKKNIAVRIKRPQPVVLIFPASEDGAMQTQKLLRNTKTDLRYLVGGYEAMTFDANQAMKTIGFCPTCPGKGK
jgi:rhodanese-related sulfurtransferase